MPHFPPSRVPSFPPTRATAPPLAVPVAPVAPKQCFPMLRKGDVVTLRATIVKPRTNKKGDFLYDVSIGGHTIRKIPYQTIVPVKRH